MPTVLLFLFPSYLRSATNETISKFNDIITGLNAFEFGSFDEFLSIKDEDITDLDHINMTELYKRVIWEKENRKSTEMILFFILNQVTFRCEELFLEPCWWRNKYYNCCEGIQSLFAMQKSEYGICYAFNSVLNKKGMDRNVIFIFLEYFWFVPFYNMPNFLTYLIFRFILTEEKLQQRKLPLEN